MIPMVDLRKQYDRIRTEIDDSILRVMESCTFIGGPEVEAFTDELAEWLGVKHVIPVANGTDALQIALMTAGLKQGDEVIVPAFTYIAPAEAIALLGLVPVFIDVDPDTFNITASQIEKAITTRTRAVIPVHLFGQSCLMEEIRQVADRYNLVIIEDNAQSFGARYTAHGRLQFTGTQSSLSCTSFFPTKNLACMGDGGAITTNNDELAHRALMIARHGQSKKYYHDVIGCNSRLDAIQAAILRVKLGHLNDYLTARREAAGRYSAGLQDLSWIQTPYEEKGCVHTYNQYTLRIKNGRRDELANFLKKQGIPSVIYYPLPLHKQRAFGGLTSPSTACPVSEQLSGEVLSLPMHTELSAEIQQFIIQKIYEFESGY